MFCFSAFQLFSFLFKKQTSNNQLAFLVRPNASLNMIHVSPSWLSWIDFQPINIGYFQLKRFAHSRRGAKKMLQLLRISWHIKWPSQRSWATTPPVSEAFRPRGYASIVSVSVTSWNNGGEAFLTAVFLPIRLKQGKQNQGPVYDVTKQAVAQGHEWSLKVKNTRTIDWLR